MAALGGFLRDSRVYSTGLSCVSDVLDQGTEDVGDLQHYEGVTEDGNYSSPTIQRPRTNPKINSFDGEGLGTIYWVEIVTKTS